MFKLCQPCSSEHILLWKPPNICIEYVLNFLFGYFQVIDWIVGPGEKLLSSHTDIGNDYKTAEKLRREHEKLELKCTVSLDIRAQFLRLFRTSPLIWYDKQIFLWCDGCCCCCCWGHLVIPVSVRSDFGGFKLTSMKVSLKAKRESETKLPTPTAWEGYVDLDWVYLVQESSRLFM